MLFGECTCEHFSCMDKFHYGMHNVDGAGFIGSSMEGIKVITGKKFSCTHFEHIPLAQRKWYVPQKRAEPAKLRIILKNKIKGTTHVVRTFDGLLNQPQVYNAMRHLCGDAYCTKCDAAGCFPHQVKMIKQGKTHRASIYEINKKDVKKAIATREKLKEHDK